MVLGMTLQTFTMVHVVISLIAIVTGLIVAWSMLNKTRDEGWIGVFLLTTALTSITGFLFPVPLSPVLPSQIFGYISLAVLVPTVLGYYVYNLTGAWRWIYVGGALLVLYLNVFVLVVQAFQKVPFLRPLFGTVWIVLIGLVIASTPLASRATDAALAQVGRELEESARVSGASALRTGIGIVTRLILPACLAAWVITAIQIAGNLEVPILLSLPTNETVAVMVYQLNARGETVQAAALFCLVLGAAALGALLLATGSALRRRWRRRGRGSAPPAAAAAPVSPAGFDLPAPELVAAATRNSKSRTDLLLGEE